MSLNFPDTPAVGLIFPTSPTVDQPQWSWDGQKWIIESTSSGVPVLTLVSMVPEFNLTGDFQIADVVRYQWDMVTTFDSGALAQATNTVDAPEDAAMLLFFEADPVTPGTWYFRARIERGAVMGAWSNIVTLVPASADDTSYVPTFISSGQF